jgi:hypothetical protein
MAHVEVTIRIPTDLDPVTAQRINQVCRAVMEQFPGIDDGPGHPFRMFLTTLATYDDVLGGKSAPAKEPTPVDVEEEIYLDDSFTPLKVFIANYTEGWAEDRDPAIDRGSILRVFMAGNQGKAAQQAFSKWGAEKVLIEAGATPEQASNIVAVGTAMQMIII